MYLQILFGVLVQNALAAHDGFIGFTAWKQVTQDYDAGDRILFEGVLINEGDAYQPALSQFTCPVSGLYYISINLMIEDYSLDVDVIVKRKVVMQLYSSSSLAYNTASNSAVVYCQSGDSIYVEGDESCNSACRIYGKTGIPYTTFTAMLLSEQEETPLKHSSFNGFSVGKETDQIYEYQDVITYSIITYTDGNWLDNVHRYTCNTSGVYYVNFNSALDEYELLELGVRKSTITYLYAEDVTTSNRYNTISNSGLIYCEAGETFAVIATGSGAVRGSEYTTFNGFLLNHRDRDTRHTSIVGFTMFKKGIQDYTAGDTITFEGILWDGNNTYDRVRNSFECSKSGIYFTSVTFQKNDTNPLYVQVERDSIIFLRSKETDTFNAWNTISNSGLISCFQGQRIKVVAAGKGSVYGAGNEATTTFTVFLMHEY